MCLISFLNSECASCSAPCTTSDSAEAAVGGKDYKSEENTGLRVERLSACLLRIDHDAEGREVKILGTHIVECEVWKINYTQEYSFTRTCVGDKKTCSKCSKSFKCTNTKDSPDFALVEKFCTSKSPCSSTASG